MRSALILLSFGLILGSCASGAGDWEGHAAADAEAGDLPDWIEAPNFIVLQPGLVGSGPPALTDVPQLKERGYATIINLRMPSEAGVAEERAAAEAAGLHYVSIPMTGSNFALADAHALREALRSAPPGDVLLHCGSGSRVGALWAMAVAVEQGLSPNDAEALALRSGAAPVLAARVAEQLRIAARP
jgi:uncharacterized protein (TIGR01244 family)